MRWRRRRFGARRRACRKGHILVSPPFVVTLSGPCERCGARAVNRAAWDELKVSIRASLDEQGEQILEGSGEGWSGAMTCGACPVQIEGVVDTLPFYFRARFESWTFDIASTPDGDPVLGGDAYSVIADYGEDLFDAGWMPHAEAWAIVEKHVAMFRAERRAS